MSTTAADRHDSRRLSQALWLVLRRYSRQITQRPWTSVPALILPGPDFVAVVRSLGDSTLPAF